MPLAMGYTVLALAPRQSKNSRVRLRRASDVRSELLGSRSRGETGGTACPGLAFVLLCLLGNKQDEAGLELLPDSGTGTARTPRTVCIEQKGFPRAQLAFLGQKVGGSIGTTNTHPSSDRKPVPATY